MKILLLVLFSLIVQSTLNRPGMPFWAPDIVVPAVFVVAPVMLFHGRRWPLLALGMGLGWDLLMEEVIGPGGIVWMATALCMESLAHVIADRSPRSWAAFGAVAAGLQMVFRWMVYWPLGLAEVITPIHLGRTVLLTSVWCGIVGWIIELNLPERWLHYRARKLR